MKQNADKAFQMSVVSSVYITLPTNYIYSIINKTLLEVIETKCWQMKIGNTYKTESDTSFSIIH